MVKLRLRDVNSLRLHSYVVTKETQNSTEIKKKYFGPGSFFKSSSSKFGKQSSTTLKTEVIITCIYLCVCMYVCYGIPCVVARGQLSRVCSLLPPRESGNPTRVIHHNWQQALLPTELSHRPRTISLIFYLLCQSMCTSSVVFLHKDSVPLHKMTVDSKDWQGCGGKGCVWSLWKAACKSAPSF